MKEYKTFKAEVLESIENSPGTWNCLEVGIFGETEDGLVEKVGSYKRNYHCLMSTFFPFKQKGKWYALYSSDYTATRVMSLPDCKDICGEEGESFGFCPVEFYVPWDKENDKRAKDIAEMEEVYADKWKGESNLGKFGFVAGCIWGDDSSWKVQFIDLSKIEEGTFTRDDRFGYQELPRSVSLKDALDFDCCEPDSPSVVLTISKHLSLTATPITAVNQSLPSSGKETAIKEISYNPNSAEFWIEFGDGSHCGMSRETMCWINSKISLWSQICGFEFKDHGKILVMRMSRYTKEGPVDFKTEISSIRLKGGDSL